MPINSVSNLQVLTIGPLQGHTAKPLLDVRRLVKHLQKSAVRMAVASNSIRRNIDPKLVKMEGCKTCENGRVELVTACGRKVGKMNVFDGLDSRVAAAAAPCRQGAVYRCRRVTRPGWRRRAQRPRRHGGGGGHEAATRKCGGKWRSPVRLPEVRFQRRLRPSTLHRRRALLYSSATTPPPSCRHAAPLPYGGCSCPRRRANSLCRLVGVLPDLGGYCYCNSPSPFPAAGGCCCTSSGERVAVTLSAACTFACVS
ncbi:hypothetical protein ACP4OV_025635 [Aristida adscensionis]